MRWYPPIVTWSLAATVVAIFYAVDDAPTALAVRTPVDAGGGTRWYDFLGAMLAHFDALHAWSNALLLLSAGALLELMHGPWPVAVMFVVGGVAGMLSEVADLDRAAARLAGASSGCYALIGGYVSHLLMNWSETPFRVLWCLAIALYASLEIAAIVATDPTRASRVAHVAHAVGFLQGALVGVVVVRNERVLPWERVLRAFALGGIVGVQWTVCAVVTANHNAALVRSFDA